MLIICFVFCLTSLLFYWCTAIAVVPLSSQVLTLLLPCLSYLLYLSSLCHVCVSVGMRTNSAYFSQKQTWLPRSFCTPENHHSSSAVFNLDSSFTYCLIIKVLGTVVIVTCFWTNLCHFLMFPHLFCHRPNSGVPACVLSEISCSAHTLKYLSNYNLVNLRTHTYLYLPGLKPQRLQVILKTFITDFFVCTALESVVTAMLPKWGFFFLYCLSYNQTWQYRRPSR